MRRSSPRLWPRHHHVEEQATERHADRERIGQLASPPVPRVCFLDRNVAVKDAAGAASAASARWTDLATGGCPSGRLSGDVGRRGSGRPRAPCRRGRARLVPRWRGPQGDGRAAARPTRRTRVARPRRSPQRGERSRDLVGLARRAARSRSRPPGATPATAASRAAHASSSGQAGWPPPSAPSPPGRSAGRAERTSSRHAVDARVVERRLDARRVVVERQPPDPSRAGRPRSRARPSRSRGRGTRRPAGRAASISSRHSRVVACAPVPNACAGSITMSTGAPTGGSHGGRTASRSPSTSGRWNSRHRSAQSSATSVVRTSTSASPAAAVRSGSAGSSPGAP